MPAKYKVTTDGGTFEVTTDEPDQQASVGARALSNLPRSAANFAHALPLASGAPMGQPEHPWVGEPGYSMTEDLLKPFKAIGNVIMHPQESFAQDPVGTAALPLALAAGGRNLAKSPAGIATVKGAASAGLEAVKSPVTRHLATTGSIIGGMIGGPKGAAMGGSLAGGIPTLTKAIEGGIEGFRSIPRANRPHILEPLPSPQREPLWTGPAGAPAEPMDLKPIPSALPSGRVPGKPAFDTSTGEMLAGSEPQGHFESPVNTGAIAKAPEAPARKTPFSPSRAARQQTPSVIKGTEPTGVKGNAKALQIAEELKKSMAGENQ